MCGNFPQQRTLVFITLYKKHRWKYTNINPTAPSLHATIKLYRHNTPIRLMINWTNAPAFKQLTKTLHKYLQLPYTYNAQNTMHLLTDL
jgi:hypothetical protein